MRFTVPGFAHTQIILESDKIGMSYNDGYEDCYHFTPKQAGDATAITGSAAGTATAIGAGGAIASLGSIGIAALGTAVAVPLFPVIGTGVAIAGTAAAVIGACNAGDAVEDHIGKDS